MMDKRHRLGLAHHLFELLEASGEIHQTPQPVDEAALRTWSGHQPLDVAAEARATLPLTRG